MFKSRFQMPQTPKLETFGEYLYYAYANMQMLIMALNSGRSKFDKTCYMVRSKAFKAYKEGRWKIHDLLINNVWKLKESEHCWYCLKEISRNELTIEHIFPRAKNGSNNMDNIVLVCSSCNSSKQDSDLLEWFFNVKKQWPWPHILAYYLKLIYLHAVSHNLLDKKSEEIDTMDLPYNYDYIPLYFPDEYLSWLAENLKENAKAETLAAFSK